MSKVSIIMASYNRPELIQEAVDSIISQTYKDWELIIVDDGSNHPQMDDAFKIIEKKFERLTNNLVIRRSKRNLNCLMFLWNNGMDLASGEYLCTVDDDNTRSPEFLECMIGELEKHPSAWAVVCTSDIIDLKGTKVGHHDGITGFTKEAMKIGNLWDSGEVVFRRTVVDHIGHWDEGIRTHEDWEYWLRMIHHPKCGEIRLLKKPLCQYRGHPGQRTVQTESLGGSVDVPAIKAKLNTLPFNFALAYPPEGRMTKSQQAVRDGVLAAMEKIDGFVDGNEIKHVSGASIDKKLSCIFVFAPFLMSMKEIMDLKQKNDNCPLHSIHCEDPAALGANLERSGFFDYIVTNDSCTLQKYRENKAGPTTWFHKQFNKNYFLISSNRGKVICMPSLSIGLEEMPGNVQHAQVYDIAFLGTAYESRVKFFTALQDLLPDLKYILIGEKWGDKNIPTWKKSRNIEVHPQHLEICDTLDYMHRSKIVLLMEREPGDLGINSMQPADMHRGYFEMAAGRPVLIGQTIGNTSLWPTEYISYENPYDCADRIKEVLADYPTYLRLAKQAQKRALQEFTYDKRIGKLIRCIRSPRFYFTIA